MRIRDTSGMTLIELLVVLVIIGILASVAVPRFNNMINRTKVSAAEQELKHASNGLWYYKTENDSLSFPPPSMITNYETLQILLRPFVGTLPEEADARFSFVSYTSADTTFSLVVRARDQERTLLTATNMGITY
ncbi:type IV pilin protein [Candidatus Zixiibacteriota bacterium]